MFHWHDHRIKALISIYFCPDVSLLFPQPENIVVEHVSSQPVIKLTDFGDAAHLGPTSSHIHPLLGSPEFSAPELVLGQPASLMSDIWSLGQQ